MATWATVKKLAKRLPEVEESTSYNTPSLKVRKKGPLTAEEREAVRIWRREHRWHPNRLRHSRATELRPFGLDVVKTILGHSKVCGFIVEADLTHPSLAVLLGLSVANVKVRLHRLRPKLEQSLEVP